MRSGCLSSSTAASSSTCGHSQTIKPNSSRAVVRNVRTCCLLSAMHTVGTIFRRPNTGRAAASRLCFSISPSPYEDAATIRGGIVPTMLLAARREWQFFGSVNLEKKSNIEENFFCVTWRAACLSSITRRVCDLLSKRNDVCIVSSVGNVHGCPRDQTTTVSPERACFDSGTSLACFSARSASLSK
jgi:hypothetical protein